MFRSSKWQILQQQHSGIATAAAAAALSCCCLLRTWKLQNPWELAVRGSALSGTQCSFSYCARSIWERDFFNLTRTCWNTFNSLKHFPSITQPGAPQQQPIMAMATSIATTLLREPPPLLPTMATSTAIPRSMATSTAIPRSIPPEPPPLSSIPPEPPPLLPTRPMVTSTILPRRIPPETPPLLEHEVSGTHFPLISIISKPLIHRFSNSTRDSLQLHVPTKKRKYFCQL